MGRKRPGEQHYGGGGGNEEGGDMGPGYMKRGRFEEGSASGGDQAELDQLDAPPATLRVLVRQIDAGAIIGKVCSTTEK